MFPCMFYKSKCRTVSCCGITVDRAVAAEEKIGEMVTMRHNPADEPNNQV